MKKAILALALLGSLGVTACTTGEVATGAVAGGAGYILGRESKD